jgi:MFS family permease
MDGNVGFRTIVSDRAVVAVVGVAFLMTLGLGIVLPILPLFARSFGVGYTEAGVLVSGYGAARLVVDIAAGAASTAAVRTEETLRPARADSRSA